jgi:hypothetical protein
MVRIDPAALLWAAVVFVSICRSPIARAHTFEEGYQEGAQPQQVHEMFPSGVLIHTSQQSRDLRN